MSSSSTPAGPFTGRLRSSTRPGRAHLSKKHCGGSSSSAAKTQDGSGETCTPAFVTTCRSLSGSLSRQGGHDVATDSPRGPGCRSAVPAVFRRSAERGTKAPPAAEGTPRMIRSNNGKGSATACRPLPATERVGRDPSEDAFEDKRAARRRRRERAAAAAAAAASMSHNSDDTRILSSGTGTHAVPAPVAQRVHGYPSSPGGRLAELPTDHSGTHEPASPCVLFSSADPPSQSIECSKVPREASGFPAATTSSQGAEGRGATLQEAVTAGVVQGCTRLDESHCGLADPGCSSAAEGMDRTSHGGAAEVGDALLCSKGLSDGVLTATRAGASRPPPNPSASGKFRSNADAATGDVSAEDMPALVGKYSVANTAVAGSCASADAAAGDARGGSRGRGLARGDDSTGVVASSALDASFLSNTSERWTTSTESNSYHSKGTHRIEPEKPPVDSSMRCEAERTTSTCGADKGSIPSCITKSAPGCSPRVLAERIELPSSVTDGKSACGTEAGEAFPHSSGAFDEKSFSGNAQEQSADRSAAKCLLQEVSRRLAQRSASSPDEAHHAEGETSGIARPVGRDGVTSREKAEQQTLVGGAFIAAGGPPATLERDTPHFAADGVSAASCLASEFHFTPVLHGLQCLRGELMLNREEFEALQCFLRPRFYRFVPCASSNDSLSGFHDRVSRVHYTCGGSRHRTPSGSSSAPLHKEGKPSSRRLAQELHALQQAACAFAALPPRGSKRRREAKFRSLPEEEGEAGSATYSSSHSSGGSSCSIGRRRRDYQGAGEDGNRSKGGDAVPFRESGGRRQQQRTRKLTLRMDVGNRGEHGAVDTIPRYRRGHRMGYSASEACEAFERAPFAESDDDASSAVSGLSRRRLRDLSVSSWKRRKSLEEPGERLSVGRKQPSLHGYPHEMRGGHTWDGRSGKSSYVEVEAFAGAGNIRASGGPRGDRNPHRRKYLPEQDGFDGLHRSKPTEYDEGVERAESRVHGSIRLTGDKQKKRAAARATLASGIERIETGSTFGSGLHVRDTALFSSPVADVCSATDWRESCYRILQHLKRQPSARWFLSPDSDVFGSYAESATQRLSLQEIEQKLTSVIPGTRFRDALPVSKSAIVADVSRERGYMHPSEWQQEVRQIFFNAFTVHPVYHEIWRDAAILAAEFERCCRLVHEVNPYYPAMLKHRRSSSQGSAGEAAVRSPGASSFMRMSGGVTGVSSTSLAQLPVSYTTHGGPPTDVFAKASEAHRNFARSPSFSGSDKNQHPLESTSLTGSQQAQMSHSGPSDFCHSHPALLRGGAPARQGAAAAVGAFSDNTANLGYLPGVALPRANCGKHHASSGSGRAGGDRVVRGKRHIQSQQEAGVSDGRGDSEDLGAVRKLGDSYGYGGQYTDSRDTLLGEGGGKNNRVGVTAAAVSPRRGGRAGRGRGTTRGGRASALAGEMHGSGASEQQLCGRHVWPSVGAILSQGTGVVPEHVFLGPGGDVQTQAFSAGGHMLAVGMATAAQPTNDASVLLMRGTGLSARGGFTAGAAVPSTGAPVSGMLLSSSSVSEAVQQMEAPVGAPVLPPPPVPRIGVNDKPLSSSQRRTLEQNMQRLSPMQRKAALELIQDDLGIVAAEYMNVKAFGFDTELLSIEKQKRLFAYVNSMFRANREILLRLHEQQVVAAQANSMSASGSCTSEALQQQLHNNRRARRKRGELGMPGGVRGTHSRSASSSSSSGSDTESSSSLSSSDSSSSTSSSETEEEDSGGSEDESEYCQGALSSATHVASDAAHPGADGESGGSSSRCTFKERTAEAAERQMIRNAGGEGGGLMDSALVASVRDSRKGDGEKQSGDSKLVNDQLERTADDQQSSGVAVAEVIVERLSRRREDTAELSTSGERQGGAEERGAVLLPGEAGQIPDCREGDSPRKGQYSCPSNVELSSSGSLMSGAVTQGGAPRAVGRDSFGPLSFRSTRTDSPHESGTGLSSCATKPVAASSHVMSTKLLGTRAASLSEVEASETAEGDGIAADDGHRMTGSFLGSYGPEAFPKIGGAGGRALPQYTPVCEEGAKVEIRAEVMGRHADFLGMLAAREAGASSENEGAHGSTCSTKPTAWQEWKGQVIQQGFVAQRAYASQQQRSVSEIIAEGYNARI